MKGLSSSPSSPTSLLPTISYPLSAKKSKSPFATLLLSIIALVCLLHLHPAGITGLARIGLDEVQGLTCEERGLITRESNRTEEGSRIAITVRPTSLGKLSPLKDNTLLETPFHPFLTSSQPVLFPGTDWADFDPTPNPLPGSPKASCVPSVVHTIEMIPPHQNTSDELPEVFFSFCTTPSRASEYAPIWSHFLGKGSLGEIKDSSGKTHLPGCVVVDAQGEGDHEGRKFANAALQASGTACVMKESSRVGERYEMRVLGLIKDAWVESERRRWQEGGPIVEWYLFNDDDTFWIDINDVKQILLQFDSSEDHMMGGFSEAVANFNDHGKIAFGGAGIILSRSLVRKMQGLVGTCSRKFAHIFGGDGILTHCAALARDVGYQEVVREIPGLSQMDMRGDASGFLTTGKRFLSLHHWVGWLDLVPNKTGPESVSLFAAGADAIGGRNMFRRFVFDQGRTVWTAGFSVQVHKDALSSEDLGRVVSLSLPHIPPPLIPKPLHRSTPGRASNPAHPLAQVEPKGKTN
ncbi:hypothetical protein P7C70_g7159, partial [Phenoliferia sp. Uapishka_3]